MGTTEAGKRLLDDCDSMQRAIDREWGRYPGDPAPPDYTAMIAAIEAEAVAAYRDALVELVEAAAGPDHQQSRGWCRLQAAIARAREVLRLIDGEAR